jgi:uncharacterized protein (DUF2336 family)
MRRTIDLALGTVMREGRKPATVEDELALLAMTGRGEPLVALARRPDLSLRLSGILAARGDLAALRALAGNPSAAIGHSVLLALADLSLGDPVLRGLTIARPDLPEEAVSLLWPHLADVEKATLLRAAAPYGERDIEDIADEGELRLHDALRRGELPESLEDVMADVDAGNLDPDEAVALFCAASRFADLGEFLARLLGCALLPCLNLLAMPTPRGAALLSRAAGLSRESYEGITELRRDLGWQAPSGLRVGLDAFDNLSRSAARRVFGLYVEAADA